MKKILLTFISAFVLLTTMLHAEVPTNENVTRLYVATFNRAPDSVGLYYWVEQSNLRLEQIAQSFFDQPETKALYPEGTSSEAFILSVYRNLFNREPEPEGLTYWKAELESGRVPKPVFILAAINGARDTEKYGQDKTILKNKKEVGLYFVENKLDDVEQAKEVMTGLNSSAESVTDAITLIRYFANIAPHANAGNDFLIHENQTANLDASKSFDEDGEIIAYLWKEGNEVLGIEKVLSNITLTPGIHTITLTVTDNNNKSGTDTIHVKVNKLPVAVIEGNLTNIWGVDTEFNGAKSYDLDGNIANFEWSNGANTSRAIFENLPLGDNTINLTVTDNDGGISSQSTHVQTIMCAGQEEITLLTDVNGTVNAEPHTNSVSCYKIDLTSNNIVEQYTFYMNLYDLTYYKNSYDVNIRIYDETGELVRDFDPRDMDSVGDRLKAQFDVIQDGMYYIKVYRDSRYAAKYAFSIHPSLENGLVQDEEGELNDFMTMATPLTLNADNTLPEVTGSLNITRKSISSIKNTDNTDWYSLDFSNTGTYSFYMNLYDLTYRNDSYDVNIKVYDADGTLQKDFDPRNMDSSGDTLKAQFPVYTAGKYFIKIDRDSRYAAKYAFSIHPSLENGLVQDEEGELNDFMTMATPLTLNADNTLPEVTGSLNITRKSISSIKNTDNTDWYSLDFSNTGTYSFYMNLYDLTYRNDSYDVNIKVYDADGTLQKDFDPRNMDSSGDTLKAQFPVYTAGKYFIKIDRDSRYAAKYGFGITLPE